MKFIIICLTKIKDLSNLKQFHKIHTNNRGEIIMSISLFPHPTSIRKSRPLRWYLIKIKIVFLKRVKSSSTF